MEVSLVAGEDWSDSISVGIYTPQIHKFYDGNTSKKAIYANFKFDFGDRIPLARLAKFRASQKFVSPSGKLPAE